MVDEKREREGSAKGERENVRERSEENSVA